MTAPLAGDIIEATDIAVAMLGRLGTTTATSDASATSGTTELAVDQVSISAINGYRYKIEWHFAWAGSVANDTGLVRIRVGSGTGGTQLGYMTLTTIYTSGNQLVTRGQITVEYTASATGALSFTGTVVRNSGTGTFTMRGAASNSRVLSVDYVSGA